MRKLSIAIPLLLSVTIAFAGGPETLDKLKQRAEAAKPENQPKLSLQVAERQQLAADEAYRKGNIEEGQAAIEDVARYAEKAGAAAIASHKHLKETEIKLRDLARKLEELSQTLTLEDREPVQAAMQRLEKVRDGLLQTMFGPKS
jgi:uncharacterized protein YccT (UPF0319 family)